MQTSHTHCQQHRQASDGSPQQCQKRIASVQEVERRHTDMLASLSRIKDFDLKQLVTVAERYTDSVRNAVIRHVRYAATPVLLRSTR